MSRICVSLLFSLTFLHHIAALYEDQAGKFDWKQSYVGKPKFTKYHQKHLLVLTEKNVLAALNPKNGDLVWRQVLEEGQQPLLLHVDKEITTVTGSGSEVLIRTWDPITGRILSEWTSRGENSVWGLHKNSLYQLEFHPGSHVDITVLNPTTGAVETPTRRIDSKWFRDASCAFAMHIYACSSEGQLYGINLETAKNRPTIPITTLYPSQSLNVKLTEFDAPSPSVLAIEDNRAHLLQFTDDSVTCNLPTDFEPNAIYIDHHIWEIRVTSEPRVSLVKTNMEDTKTTISYDVDYPRGVGASYLLTGTCKDNSCWLLLTTTDHALLLVRLPEGRIVWSREESLADVTAVEFFELPVSDQEASIENEFLEEDVLGMFLRRLAVQTKQLVAYLGSRGSKSDSRDLIRDDFGLHKIIVLATAVGKLVAMDTLSGAIVWTYRIPGARPLADNSMRLFVQRTARHASLPAECLLLARDQTGRGLILQFDPITGRSRNQVQVLPYVVKQALLLNQEDQNHLKPVVLIDGDHVIHVYPENGRKLIDGSTYTFIANESELIGYRLTDSGLIKVWSVDLSPGNVVAMTTRPSNERVHSQGRVLPDRSVYYKYVNPNLVAVATVTTDPVNRNVISVYLIDGVTGFVVHSSSHKRARGPVRLVHSENWLVYTYYNERFRRNEVAALELYEGLVQSNSSWFGSYAVNQLPPVLAQGYILSADVRKMAVTLTERGITNKFLLVGLASGALVELPWLLLQPRFGDHQCGPEESCIPYMPEVPLPSEATVNYNQTLANIKGIEVAPARLESTCHVLVHGLDLFYTRVAPSKTFDLLKEDFEYGFIVLVLTGLVAASYATKLLAEKKTLRQAWK